MIISGRWKFVIATPAKTGMTSLRGVAQAWARQGGDPGELAHYKPIAGGRRSAYQHQMRVPLGAETFDRWLMVREPRARLVSYFEWSRKNRVYGHDVAATGDFLAFLEWYATERACLGRAFDSARLHGGEPPYKFIDEYRTLHAIVAGQVPGATWGERPCGRLRLERIDTELARVARVAEARYTSECGEPPVVPFRFPPVPRRNAAKPGERIAGRTRWQDYWTSDDDGNQARLDELARVLCAADEAWLTERVPEPDDVLAAR